MASSRLGMGFGPLPHRGSRPIAEQELVDHPGSTGHVDRVLRESGLQRAHCDDRVAEHDQGRDSGAGDRFPAYSWSFLIRCGSAGVEDRQADPLIDSP
jgi:hypothetical protein